MALTTSEKRILLEKINKIDKISDQEWKASLTERKLKELEFHDKDRDQSRVEKIKTSDTYEKFYGNKKYYSATKRSSQYVKDWIEREQREGFS